MGQLLKDNSATRNQSPRQTLESRFASARHNILLVVVFTAINIILLVTNSNMYFLFSAYIPYILVDLGMLFCGLYPSEIYAEEFAGMALLDRSFFTVMLVIAGVIIGVYLLSWVLSRRNKVGWMILALVFFGVDTALMLLLNGIALESIVDIVFHGWVIFSLASGINAHCKLKKLPDEEQLPDASLDPMSESQEPVIQQ